MAEPAFKSRIKLTPQHLATCLCCGYHGWVVKWDEDLRGEVCAPCVSVLDNAQHALQYAGGIRPPAFNFQSKDAIPDREVVT